MADCERTAQVLTGASFGDTHANGQTDVKRLNSVFFVLWPLWTRLASENSTMARCIFFRRGILHGRRKAHLHMLMRFWARLCSHSDTVLDSWAAVTWPPDDMTAEDPHKEEKLNVDIRVRNRLRGSDFHPSTTDSWLSSNMCSTVGLVSDFFVTSPKHMALNRIAVCTCGLKGHLWAWVSINCVSATPQTWFISLCALNLSRCLL